MDKEDARYQKLGQLHERRKQVVRLHRKGHGVMAIAGMTGLSYPAARLAIDLFEEGGYAALQRLTSLSAVIRGEPVSVRGRRRPIDLLFNLEHPDQLAVVTEVDENGDDAEVDAGQSHESHAKPSS